MDLNVLGGSIRCIPAAETVRHAWPLARRLGVTRSAEVTWLDRIGIPTFSATRPRAGIVCVTAGKGRTADEAHAGALLENIEQATAEMSQVNAEVLWLSPAEAEGVSGVPLMSWCPRVDRRVPPDRMPWVTVADLASGQDILVPAESVFIPACPPLNTGFIGSSTTGLASGNTFEEAALHGLCEVLERDTTSLDTVLDRSVAVTRAGLPEVVSDLLRRIEEAGLRVWLRTSASVVGVAYFSCVIVDDDVTSPLTVNGGYGCHPVAVIAAVRAVTEAAQSRLTYIQGAREDLDSSYGLVDGMSPDRRREFREELIQRYEADDTAVAFDCIPTAVPAGPAALLAGLVRLCSEAGFTRVGAYRYPFDVAPFDVVRIAVPGAEHFTQETRRVGSRLAAEARRARTREAPRPRSLPPELPDIAGLHGPGQPQPAALACIAPGEARA